jgi:hypothetical protein
MGCASFTAFIVAIVQTPSDGSVQPIENSPPEIHTIPSNAFVGGGVLLGTVGAKVEPFVTPEISLATATSKEQLALTASTLKIQRIVCLCFMESFLRASGWPIYQRFSPYSWALAARA